MADNVVLCAVVVDCSNGQVRCRSVLDLCRGVLLRRTRTSVGAGVPVGAAQIGALASPDFSLSDTFLERKTEMEELEGENDSQQETIVLEKKRKWLSEEVIAKEALFKKARTDFEKARTDFEKAEERLKDAENELKWYEEIKAAYNDQLGGGRR